MTTNNNNTKPITCYCGKLMVATNVAGVQCFECETVDNNAAGTMFEDAATAWKWYGDKVTMQIAEHEAGPNYIPPQPQPSYEEWPPVEGGHFNDGMW